MNTISINVQEPYASQILNGTKTVEGQLNKGKFAAAQVGEHVLLNETVEFVITGKKQYATFKEMLEQEGVAKVIPDAKSLAEAVQVYYAFYMPEEEREFGWWGLRLGFSRNSISWGSCPEIPDNCLKLVKTREKGTI